MIQEKIARINQLKKDQNTLILAHYYVDEEIQKIADFVGDSYYLAQMATNAKETTLLMCGVNFMAESAKILNPEKTVLLPDLNADCPMAHMSSVDKIKNVRKKYSDVAVVCYVNSSIELKAHSDVCVTSGNALKIVKALPQKRIYFIPDQNLAYFIAQQLPEKEFIFNDGFCHVHAAITTEIVTKEKEKHPKAEILVHPECSPNVVALADYVGSTSGIIKQAGNSPAKEFIVLTEIGVLFELRKRYPDKSFYTPTNLMTCPDMKKLNLDKVLQTLENKSPEIIINKALLEQAKQALDSMMDLAN